MTTPNTDRETSSPGALRSARWGEAIPSDGVARQPLQSILDTTEAAWARHVLDDLASAVAAAPDTSLALGSGLAGQLLFCAYHARASGSPASEEAARVASHRLLVGLGTRLPATLHGGFVGLGWTLAHLNGGEDQLEQVLERVDHALLSALSVPHWTQSYDLISGLTGLAIYGIERYPAPAGDAIVERVLAHLEALAIPRGAGHAWFTPPENLVPWQRELAPAGYYNFGLSHGVPGVIYMLALCILEGVQPRRARQLLEPAMTWLLSRRLPVGSPACFPTWELEPAPALGSRLAWCYGDPGTAVALLAASQAVGRSDWRQAALEVAHWAARPDASGGVIDASVCHGAFGLAHIFHRLYRATASDTLLAAARRWTAHALSMRKPGQGLGGYRYYQPKERLKPGQSPESYREAWVDEAGLLMGSSGAGLTLLTLLEPELPSWDLPLLTALDDLTD